ncbi:hypothetical protein HFP72_12390 [Nocardiopsis sp. ARC36]
MVTSGVKAVREQPARTVVGAGDGAGGRDAGIGPLLTGEAPGRGRAPHPGRGRTW